MIKASLLHFEANLDIFLHFFLHFDKCHINHFSCQRFFISLRLQGHQTLSLDVASPSYLPGLRPGPGGLGQEAWVRGPGSWARRPGPGGLGWGSWAKRPGLGGLGREAGAGRPGSGVWAGEPRPRGLGRGAWTGGPGPGPGTF